MLPALITAFNRENESYYSYMAEGFVAVTSALEPTECARPRGSWAMHSRERTRNLDLRQTLSQGFAFASSRVASEEMDRLISQLLDREDDLARALCESSDGVDDGRRRLNGGSCQDAARSP